MEGAKTSASPIARPVTRPLPASMRTVKDWPRAMVVSAGTANIAGVPAVDGSLHAVQTPATAANHQMLRNKIFWE